jgi:hypothetical protein
MSRELDQVVADMHAADKRIQQTMHEVTPDLLMFFGRMEAKLDASLEWMRRHEVEADRLTDRVKRLEETTSRNTGIAATIAFIVSSAATIISYTLFGGSGS